MKVKSKSPVNKPLFKQEPLLDLRRVHVHVAVETADDKHLFVVVHGLCAEELFGLLEGALLALDFVALRVVDKAVRDPALVAAKDKYLAVVQGEAAHGVPGGPGVVLRNNLQRLPLLILKLCEAVQALERVEGRFGLAFPACNHEQEPLFYNAHRMEMATLV